MIRTRLTTTVLMAVVAVTGIGTLHAQPPEENQRYRLAQGYEASGDLKNAARVYRELYDRDHGSNVYFEGVRRTYIALNRFDELLPLVEDRVRSLGRDVALRVAYADLLARMGRRDDATREWRAAIDLYPNDQTAYGLVAQSQIDNRAFDMAVGTYRLGRSRLGDPGVFADRLAPVLALLSRYEEASEEYLAMLDADPNRLGTVMGGMGGYTATPDGADAAIRMVRDRLESRSEHLPYLQLLSWLYTERGEYDDAFDIVKRLDRVRNSRGSEVYAFAERSLRDEKFDAAIRAAEYFRATYPKDNPLYPAAVLAYANALEGRYRALPDRRKADAEDLAKRYRAIAEENAGTTAAPQALFDAARIEANDLDNPKEAIALLTELADRYPRFPELGAAMLLRADLHLRMGELDQARKLYADGAERPALDEEGDRVRDMFALRRAEMLFFDGKFTEAAAQFGSLAENTTSEIANDALGYQFLLQDNSERNAEALKHYASGLLLLRRHMWSEAGAELDRAAGKGGEGSLGDEALLAKAQAQEMEGRMAEAVATLTGLVSSYADGSVADRALFHAAELTERLGDRTKAMELYARVLTEYGSSSYAEPARLRIRALRGD